MSSPPIGLSFLCGYEFKLVYWPYDSGSWTLLSLQPNQIGWKSPI